MLQVEGFLAAFILALLGSVIFVSLNPEDKRDGGLIFLLAAITLGASIYSDNPSVALALKVLLALQAMFVVGWLLRRRLGRP